MKSTSDKFTWSSKVEISLYKFYRIISVCPISIQQRSSELIVKFERKIRLWSIGVIVFVLIYLAIMVCLRLCLLSNLKLIRIWSIITHIEFTFSTCLIILIETQFSHKHHIELLILKEKTENAVRKLCSHEQLEQQKYSAVKTCLIVLVTFLTFTLTIQFATLHGFDTLSIFYALWLMLPRVYNRLRSFHYIYISGTLYSFIKLVRIKVEECINEIEQSNQSDRQLFEIKINLTRIFNDLNSSMKIYSSVARMAFLMKKVFGFSMFMLFLQDSTSLLTHFFWVYSKLFYRDLNGIPGSINS